MVSGNGVFWGMKKYNEHKMTKDDKAWVDGYFVGYEEGREDCPCGFCHIKDLLIASFIRITNSRIKTR